MIEGFELHAEGLIALEHAREDFLSRLDQAFGPARLLRLERRHFDRKLGGALYVLAIDEFPSLELGAVREVGVFG